MNVRQQKTVYLVDGSSYIHRAYHAIRNLSNSKGFPTNAIFGFVKMLLKLMSEEKPAYLAVVFDTEGPTFRHALYELYKANRPPMPEDLAMQIPHIKAILKGLSVPILEKKGFEADDVIGTLSRRAEKENFNVVVVTGDKDFRQIISARTSLRDTMKDKSTDYDSLVDVYGLKPEQFIDVMGLSGDSSDNIPGVPGVGEKTAADLIRQFGSLESIYENLDAIKKKRLRENLEAAFENAVLSKKLVTIDRFVPLDGEIEALKIGEPDRQKLSKIFREMEFRDLWEQFAEREERGENDYRLCLSPDGLRSDLAQIQKEGQVSVDTETTSEDPHRAELVGISISWEDHQAVYLPLGHSYLGAPRQLVLPLALEMVKEVLQDGSIKKIGQNIKYDALVLRRYGTELKGIHFDTMVASYVLNPSLRQHNLDSLAQHFLGHKMIPFSEVVGKGKGAGDFSEVDVETAMAYSCEDADITLRLMGVMEKKLQSDMNQDLFHEMEMKLIPVLMDMEWQGIKIDVPFFKDMSKRFSGQLQAIEKEIYTEAGMEFNINSPQQLSFVLFEKLGLPVQKRTTKTKAYSTDVKVLNKLASLPYKIPKLLLRYRTLSKLKSTYLDALVKMADSSTGRIHTTFNQTVAATGRLSSSDPNLQNIPVRGEEGREIRKGFIADHGHVLLSADYSQVELRVFAHYSGDPAFLEAFSKGEDIHLRTASEILNLSVQDVTPDMRRIAKAINFGIIYGMGPQKLSEELGIDLKTAKDYIATYYERYQGVVRYRERTIAFAREKGYVTTLFNRRRYLPDINHENRVLRAEAERMAVNTPIQGTAADLIKKAMINIHARLESEKLKTKMLLQVHDELVFEVPEAETSRISSLVKEEMEGVYPMAVPLKVDVNMGRNWDEAH
ncbi:MAG: DNA polymerase I [Deltaproteobacteria bacterium]